MTGIKKIGVLVIALLTGSALIANDIQSETTIGRHIKPEFTAMY